MVAVPDHHQQLAAATMSSADELFHNGQIRPVCLAAALLQPHPDPAMLLDFPPDATAEAQRIRHGAATKQEKAGAA
jgi:hypothetical protein